MESIRKNYLLEKYKDVVGKEMPKFEQALEEASDHSFSDIIDIDTSFKSKPATLAYGIILGHFGADRFYLGDRKLGFIKLAARLGVLVLDILLLILMLQVPGVATTCLFAVLYTIMEAVMLGWWIADIILCSERVNVINRCMLLAASKSKQDDTEADKPHNYHKDIYKTICFYDKYKTEISKPNREKFKSSVFYVPDSAYDYVEKVELKDKKKMMMLSGFGGLLGLGSFYLGNTKRGILQIIINLVLIAAIVVIAMMNVLVLTIAITLAVLIGLGFRWGAEIDVCNYYINVINGQKILDALSTYRDCCKSE